MKFETHWPCICGEVHPPSYAPNQHHHLDPVRFGGASRVRAGEGEHSCEEES